MQGKSLEIACHITFVKSILCLKTFFFFEKNEQDDKKKELRKDMKRYIDREALFLDSSYGILS